MPSSYFSPEAVALARSLIPPAAAVPGPDGLMEALLYAAFVPHLLLMNAVLGTAALTLFYRLRPRSASPTPHGPDLARDADLLLPKGVAFTVNLGIPPFLFLQAVYGHFLYVSSILMAAWWLSVMAVVMLAYYGLYINMARRGLSEGARTLALGLAVPLLFWNAFLFVNNMTLLRNLEAWPVYAQGAGGVFLNLGDPQLAPRYLHVVFSCLAVGGLCLALPAQLALRRSTEPEELSEIRLRRDRGLKWFTHATLAQIPVGVWFFLSLPEAQQYHFMSGKFPAAPLFYASLLMTGAVLTLAWKKRTVAVAVCTALLVALMAGVRTLLRSSEIGQWRAPALELTDAVPPALFLVSLALTGVGLFFLLRIYFRNAGAAGHRRETTAERREELRDALLVNETAESGADLTPDGRGSGS